MQVVQADQNDKLCDWNTSDFAVYPAARIGFAVKPTTHELLIPTGTTSFFKGILRRHRFRVWTLTVRKDHLPGRCDDL